MKPTLLWIDHSFHQKTKSSDFMKDIVSEKYNLTYFDYFPGEESHLEKLKKSHYNIIILWQVMPDLNELKKYISFDRCIFFPMYDGCLARWNEKWYSYGEVIIINFCRKLHEEFCQMGFTSHYIQYFPKPMQTYSKGDENSVFFWNRITSVNLPLLCSILPKIKKIHCHKVIDPYQKFIIPKRKYKKKITYSTWFETREEMQQKICESALYFAPRLEEGIGMSFLEAMAMGRCVIAPDNPTMNEYIQNNETGFLYATENPMPITFKNISEIQKKAFEYIKEGYKKWEENKYLILDWITDESVPKHHNIQLLVQPSNFKKDKIEIKLFGIFPFLKIKIQPQKINVKLWGIPLLKIKQKG